MTFSPRLCGCVCICHDSCGGGGDGDSNSSSGNSSSIRSQLVHCSSSSGSLVAGARIITHFSNM